MSHIEVVISINVEGRDFPGHPAAIVYRHTLPVDSFGHYDSYLDAAVRAAAALALADINREQHP
jgi:hypothetical protein